MIHATPGWNPSAGVTADTSSNLPSSGAQHRHRLDATYAWQNHARLEQKYRPANTTVPSPIAKPCQARVEMQGSKFHSSMPPASDHLPYLLCEQCLLPHQWVAGGQLQHTQQHEQDVLAQVALGVVGAGAVRVAADGHIVHCSSTQTAQKRSIIGDPAGALMCTRTYQHTEGHTRRRGRTDNSVGNAGAVAVAVRCYCCCNHWCRSPGRTARHALLCTWTAAG